MDRLPATITDQALLRLLGRIIESNPTAQSTGELRLRFFQPGFSWQALVDLAVAHDLLPPLIFALRQRGLLPPPPTKLRNEPSASHVTCRLGAAYEGHLRQQEDLRSQLWVAAAALNAADIVPVLLKGAVHLTSDLRDWQESRSMRDLDILVRSTKAETASRILVSLGYNRDPNPPPFDRHLPELWLPGHAGTVEIHIEALSFPSRYALTTEEVFRRAVPKNFGGTVVRLLPSEWHLLHGLLHHQLSDRGHARRMLALKGLWEFSRVGADVTPERWNTVIEHAKSRGVFDVLSSWSLQAQHLFGLRIQPELLRCESGRKHADATFRRARAPFRLRQVLLVWDKLRFAFSPETLARRYGGDGKPWQNGLHHLEFLWRRRSLMRRWIGY